MFYYILNRSIKLCVFALLLRCLLVCAKNIDKKNVVFILTDDQDLELHGLMPMKKTLNLLGNSGATFENAFVTTPICCPSRSSILTGLYSHNHKAFNNTEEGGCVGENWRSLENQTFGAYLHDNDYRTFFAGKYLNQYKADYVPEGWDWWIGLKENSRYYDYDLSVNGTLEHHDIEYLPDLMKDHALNFLESINDQPFLMVLSTPSPHSPATPAPRHLNKFKNVSALRTASFNKHYEDKHWLLNMPPETLSEDALDELDRIYRTRWECLLAVDDMVEAVIENLENLGILEDTYVILTSDNGYHIGQFAQAYDKRQPYDTDIKVPLLIRGPKIPAKSLIKHPVANIDFAPTLLELSGLSVPKSMDGQSFANIFQNWPEYEKITNEFSMKHSVMERQILVEYWGEANPHTISKACVDWHEDKNLARCDPLVDCRCQDSRNNTYSCIRHIATDFNFMLCHFNDSENFVEAYDLIQDPFELKNIAYEILPAIREKYLLIIDHLKQCSGETCHKIY